MRLARLLAASALALGLIAPAPAHAAGACATSSGVTVVVDFGRLGGGVQVRCAATSGSGLDALRVAGFAVTGTQRYGTAFVCRIDGRPDASSEKCVNTPPADASWRYFTAVNGGGWSYSQTGASGRKVVQGGFEGWSFGAGTTPRFAPRRAGDGGPSGGGHTGGTDADGTTSGDGSVLAGPSSTEDEALPKPRRRTGASTTPSDAPTPSTELTAENNSVAPEESSGSVTPWVGIALLGLLLAGVLFAARRRRRRGVF